MKGGIIIKGIDVSRHQGDIDWAKVKNDNIEFAIIRAGYGNSISQKDIKYDANYKGAKDNGLKVGAYWFSYATSQSDAVKEANVFKEVIKGHSLDLPIFLDYEYDSVTYGNKMGITLTRDIVTNMAKVFMDNLSGSGYKVGIYTNPDFINNWFDMGRLSGYPVWLAKWTSTAVFDNPPTGYGDLICWQYSSKGSVNGIVGNVDLNFGYFTEDSGGSVPVTGTPANPVASVTASVLNVRSGPGTGYRIIRTVTKGNLVDVLESYTNGWSKISVAGLVAYVNHSYLSAYKQPLAQYKASESIKVGSKVKVKSGAKTYDGKSLASFVYNTVYNVIQINGNRVVIGLGSLVTAAVHIDNLTLY